MTRNLREAEEELERTRARAEALGLQAWSDATSRTRIVYNDEHDGYHESQDPANDAGMMDRGRINTWVGGVGAFKETSKPSTPIIEGDTESVRRSETGSVHISDSCSVFDDDPKQRRRIYRWQEHQELLRKARLGIEA